SVMPRFEFNGSKPATSAQLVEAARLPYSGVVVRTFGRPRSTPPFQRHLCFASGRQTRHRSCPRSLFAFAYHQSIRTAGCARIRRDPDAFNVDVRNQRPTKTDNFWDHGQVQVEDLTRKLDRAFAPYYLLAAVFGTLCFIANLTLNTGWMRLIAL